MATQPIDHAHKEAFEEYCVYARLCQDKHGLPWPLDRDEAENTPLDVLRAEIRKLKDLARTPREG